MSECETDEDIFERSSSYCCGGDEEDDEEDEVALFDDDIIVANNNNDTNNDIKNNKHALLLLDDDIIDDDIEDEEYNNADINNLLDIKIGDDNINSDHNVCNEEHDFADYELVNLNFQPTTKLKDSTVIDYDFSISKMLQREAVPGSWLYNKIVTSTPVLATKILLQYLHVDELRYCCMDPDPNNIYGEEGGGSSSSSNRTTTTTSSKSNVILKL